MSRGGEPIKRDDPERFAGLTARRRERGLPVGSIQDCGCPLIPPCTCPLPYGPADDCPFHATRPFWVKAPGR